VEDESDLEAYLLRIVPNLASTWEGATEEEIAAVERLAPRPLPPFYRWFLRRMGRSMGAMAYPSIDFSVRAVLGCYAAEDFLLPSERYFMIGYEEDEVMPLHVFYDLETPARGDALVVLRDAQGGDRYPSFETFREMLTWGKASRFAVTFAPQSCRGMLIDDELDIFGCLDPVMASLGFRQPVLTGNRCRVFERADATMICHGTPLEQENQLSPFRLGAPDEATLRSILGTIALETRLTVEVDEWMQPPVQPPR
jgi:hypothetical protein